MSPQEYIDPEDLPLYAMQLLPPDQAALVQAYVDQNPTTRQEVAEIQGVLASFAFASDMQAPSPSARSRFLNSVAQEKRVAPSRPIAVQPARAAQPVEPIQAAVAEPAKVIEIPVGPPASDAPSFFAEHRRNDAQVLAFDEAPARHSLVSRVIPWVGWAVAAGLALTTGNLYQKSENLKRSYSTQQAQLAHTAADAATARDVMAAMTDDTARRVTLTRAGALLTPTGRTVYSAEKGVLIFSATNMEPVQSFKVYELWLIPTGGGKPIPAGTFRPDARGTASMVLTTLPKGVEAKAFGITIEEEGGSKTPTLPILMTGA